MYIQYNGEMHTDAEQWVPALTFIERGGFFECKKGWRTMVCHVFLKKEMDGINMRDMSLSRYEFKDWPLISHALP